MNFQHCKPLMLVFALCLTDLTGAEIPQGARTLGGLFSYVRHNQIVKQGNSSTITNYYPTRYISFKIQPELSQFIKQNLSVGLSIGYEYEVRNTYENSYKNKISYYNSSGIPFQFLCTKNIDLSKEFNFWVGIHAGGTKIKYRAARELQYGPAKIFTTDGYAFNVGLQFGAIWFPAQKIGLKLGIGGIGYFEKYEESVDPYSSTRIEKNNTFNINLNRMSLALGLNYFFNNKS